MTLTHLLLQRITILARTDQTGGGRVFLFDKYKFLRHLLSSCGEFLQRILFVFKTIL